MRFLEKLQKLPEGKRKIILWLVIIIIGILFFNFYIKNLQQKLKNFSSEELKEQLKIKEFPKIEFPKIEFPKIPKSEEELEKRLNEGEIETFEEMLKENKDNVK